jgi:L-asparaginase
VLVSVPAPQTRRPVVAVLTTGGTIAALGHDRLDLTRYGETSTRVAAEDLVASVPELTAVADVRVRAVLDRPSHDLSFEDLVTLARAVDDESRADGVAGVVVTHGTNTLEETAYFLELTRTGVTPVVVTGAMRPASALSADGPANLLNAVRLAAAPAARGCGVLVTMNDLVHAARDVTKAASSGVGAFASPRLGPAGRIAPSGEVELRSATAARSIAAATDLGPVPRVEIVTSGLGADGALVEAAVTAGAAGIVVAATGAGFMPERQEAALRRAAEAGVAVLVTTRTGSGPVTRTADGVLVNVSDLQPWKARILLAVTLAAGWSVERVAAYLDPA